MKWSLFEIKTKYFESVICVSVYPLFHLFFHIGFTKFNISPLIYIYIYIYGGGGVRGVKKNEYIIYIYIGFQTWSDNNGTEHVPYTFLICILLLLSLLLLEFCGALSVTVIVVEGGFSYPRSNSGRGCSHYR